MSIPRTGVAAFFLLAGTALAGIVSSQGFETGTGDWVGGAGITQVGSSGGVLGVASASGASHAEVRNLNNDYQTGRGDAGFSRFGSPALAGYQGDFSQSIDIFVNVNWAAPTGDGLWLDMSPGHPVGNYGAEHNFQLNATGSAVNILADDGLLLTSIGVSGWYTFEMVHSLGANPDDIVTTEMTVYNATHVALGSTTKQAVSPGGPLLSRDLSGPGYVWLTNWENGFAGDVLAIDNVDLSFSPTPEPATWSLFAIGAGLVALARRYRR